MDTYQGALDALGDPTRRTVFDHLRLGPTAVGQLARQFPVSRSAISQHLRVLSHAGLIQQSRQGTRRLYALNPDGLIPLRTYLDGAWAEALARFQSIADDDRKGDVKLAQSKIDLAIRKSVSVRLPTDRAFALFTEGISKWWPYQTKSISQDRAVSVVLEGWAGGRLFEQIAGGGQALWGHVCVWDPPARLVISWTVNPDNPPTVIEVTFTPNSDGTLVHLEHRGWENYGESATNAASEYSTGWDEIFSTRYREAAEV